MQTKKLLEKLTRSLVIYVPSLKDGLYFLKRLVRTTFRLPVESDFAAVRLFPNEEESLFLDIGGNQGAAVDTLLALNKHCRIYSFEPNPDVYIKTAWRFRANKRVTVFNFGFGDQEGEFKLFVPVYRGYKFDGLASLNADFDDTWLSKNILFYNKAFLSLCEVTCTIKRVDDLGLSPFFMKIDVEGLELEVLDGAKRTIGSSTPIILLETGDKDREIAEWLGQFGYRIYRFAGGKFIAGERGRQNSFFMTDEKFRLVSSKSSAQV